MKLKPPDHVLFTASSHSTITTSRMSGVRDTEVIKFVHLASKNNSSHVTTPSTSSCRDTCKTTKSGFKTSGGPPVVLALTLPVPTVIPVTTKGFSGLEVRKVSGVSRGSRTGGLGNTTVA